MSKFEVSDLLQGAFENNPSGFEAKDFLNKPPIQFFRGLDYLQIAARCASCYVQDRANGCSPSLRKT